MNSDTSALRDILSDDWDDLVCYDVASLLRESNRRLGEFTEAIYRSLGKPLGRLPAEPTKTLPGTEARMLIYQGRFLRGEALHHPADAVGRDDE